MRHFAALVILWIFWTASGCATGLQGVALLAGSQPAVRQPIMSEFASAVQNYSDVAAQRSRPDARNGIVTVFDGGVTVSDGQIATRDDVGDELQDNRTPVHAVPPVPPAADPTPAENRPGEDPIDGETLAYADPSAPVESQPMPVAPEPDDIVVASDDVVRQPEVTSAEHARGAPDGDQQDPIASGPDAIGTADGETLFDAYPQAGPLPDVQAKRWAAREPYRDSLPGADPQADVVVEDGPSTEAKTYVAREPVPTAPLVGATSTDAPPHLVMAADQAEVVQPPPPAGPFKARDEDNDIERFSRRVAEVPLDIRPTDGVMPTDLAAREFEQHATVDPRQSHDVPEIFCSYTPWTICFRPLYFEEVDLERYGQKRWLFQSPASGVQFLKNIALLPYKMRVRPPRSYVCSNGFSRVGDCPPPGYGECVWRWDAAIIEVAAVTGFVFILP